MVAEKLLDALVPKSAGNEKELHAAIVLDDEEAVQRGRRVGVHRAPHEASLERGGDTRGRGVVCLASLVATPTLAALVALSDAHQPRARHVRDVSRTHRPHDEAEIDGLFHVLGLAHVGSRLQRRARYFSGFGGGSCAHSSSASRRFASAGAITTCTAVFTLGAPFPCFSRSFVSG